MRRWHWRSRFRERGEVLCGNDEEGKGNRRKGYGFGSPNGLDSHLTAEQHHSTAYDMALIGAYALENETFREIIAQQEIYVSDLTGKHSCSVTNADRFLQEYSGALGIKTGYTNRAGHCFVGAAERDGVRLVSAVLGSGWGMQASRKSGRIRKP